MLHIGPGVRRQRHPQSGQHPSIVTLERGPELFLLADLEAVPALGVEENPAGVYLPFEGYGMQTDVYFIVHQPAVGDADQLAVMEAEEEVFILHPLPLDGQELPEDPGADNIVVVILGVQGQLQKLEDRVDLFLFNRADQDSVLLPRPVGDNGMHRLHRRRVIRRLKQPFQPRGRDIINLLPQLGRYFSLHVLFLLCVPRSIRGVFAVY